MAKSCGVRRGNRLTTRTALEDSMTKLCFRGRAVPRCEEVDEEAA